MTFFGLLPSSALLQHQGRERQPQYRPFVASRVTVTSARFLPLICTGRVMVFSTRRSGLDLRPVPRSATKVLWPSAAQHSSARCGHHRVEQPDQDIAGFT